MFDAPVYFVYFFLPLYALILGSVCDNCFIEGCLIFHLHVSNNYFFPGVAVKSLEKCTQNPLGFSEYRLGIAALDYDHIINVKINGTRICVNNENKF